MVKLRTSVAGMMLAAGLGVMIALGFGSVVPPVAQAGDFQVAAAKRLAPPKGRLSTRKRLMDPSLPSPQSNRKFRGRQAFKWFWQEVSTSRAAASAARWSSVLQVVERGRAKGKPVYGSRATAQRILKNYGPYLKKEAKRRNVSLPLLIAVIAVESNGNPGARSPVGAGGLMQLMPATARRFGVSNAYAPSQNIRGGAHYLDWLLRYFNGDAVLALAGYNAGEGAVNKYKGVPPFRETRDYVAKVAGAYLAARTLCSNPPRSARAACDIK
ncbi:MAG: lytic transglycosylase domain-containing protein [Pseudomonadota bacterium]